MRASTVRHFSRALPVPGSVVRRLLRRYDHAIHYPDHTVVARCPGVGSFEIQDCHEYIQRSIYFLGYYEIRETRLVRRLLRRGDTFVDVGANIGWFTLVAARCVGQQGRVIAFEPSSSVFAQLARNVALNSAPNVVLERLALSHSCGTALLSNAAPDNGGTRHITLGDRRPEDVAGEPVATMTLDAYVETAGLKRIRLIKIDVEGAEFDVLSGMRSALKRQACDYVIIEVEDGRLVQEGRSSMELLRFLSECGYTLSSIGLFGRRALDLNQRIAFANVLAEAPR